MFVTRSRAASLVCASLAGVSLVLEGCDQLLAAQEEVAQQNNNDMGPGQSSDNYGYVGSYNPNDNRYRGTDPSQLMQRTGVSKDDLFQAGFEVSMLIPDGEQYPRRYGKGVLAALSAVVSVKNDKDKSVDDYKQALDAVSGVVVCGGSAEQIAACDAGIQAVRSIVVPQMLVEADVALPDGSATMADGSVPDSTTGTTDASASTTTGGVSRRLEDALPGEEPLSGDVATAAQTADAESSDEKRNRYVQALEAVLQNGNYIGDMGLAYRRGSLALLLAMKKADEFGESSVNSLPDTAQKYIEAMYQKRNEGAINEDDIFFEAMHRVADAVMSRAFFEPANEDEKRMVYEDVHGGKLFYAVFKDAFMMDASMDEMQFAVHSFGKLHFMMLAADLAKESHGTVDDMRLTLEDVNRKIENPFENDDDEMISGFEGGVIAARNQIAGLVASDDTKNGLVKAIINLMLMPGTQRSPEESLAYKEGMFHALRKLAENHDENSFTMSDSIREIGGQYTAYEGSLYEVYRQGVESVQTTFDNTAFINPDGGDFDHSMYNVGMNHDNHYNGGPDNVDYYPSSPCYGPDCYNNDPYNNDPYNNDPYNSDPYNGGAVIDYNYNYNYGGDSGSGSGTVNIDYDGFQV